ncbi:hypothetical protein KC341_g17 [Hortaea werneckii]|nr:hypothetical protein KC341_g17 [Hortaea werneckii]
MLSLPRSKRQIVISTQSEIQYTVKLPFVDIGLCVQEQADPYTSTSQEPSADHLHSDRQSSHLNRIVVLHIFFRIDMRDWYYTDRVIQQIEHERIPASGRSILHPIVRHCRRSIRRREDEV